MTQLITFILVLARPCVVDGDTYKDNETFQPDCSQTCTCQDGQYACVSKCPQVSDRTIHQHVHD